MHVFLYQIARTTGGTNAGISRQNTTERRGKGTVALAFALELITWKPRLLPFDFRTSNRTRNEGAKGLMNFKKYRSIDKFTIQYVSHMQLHMFYFVSHRKLFDLLIASCSAFFVLFPITCNVITIIFSCSAHIDH